MDGMLRKTEPDSAAQDAEDQVAESSDLLLTSDRKEARKCEVDDKERVIRAVSGIPLTY